MIRLQAFSQWIYEFDVPPDILQQLNDVALKVSYAPTQTNFNSFVPETLQMKELVPIRQFIDGHLNQIKLDLGLECEQLRLNIEWFNRSDKGMWHHAHTHDNAFVSGILYITPSDAETIFSVPSIWGKENMILNLVSQDNMRVFQTYPTTPGKMLIFPATITHSVSEHTLDYPRYTMSFNAFPSGFIGSYSDQHYRKFMNITVHQDQ